MIVLFSTTIISCSDALGIISRLSNVIGLTYDQKVEIVKIIKGHVPSCPVYIKLNEKPKR